MLPGRLEAAASTAAVTLIVQVAMHLDACPQPCAQAIAVLEAIVVRTDWGGTAGAAGDLANRVLFPTVDLLMDVAVESASTVCHLQRLLHGIYSAVPAAQDAVREVLMLQLAAYLDDPADSRSVGADALLQTLLPLIAGFRSPLRAQAPKAVLLRCLAPLAISPKGNPLTGQAEAEFYASTLAQCVRAFVGRLAPDETADYVTRFFLTVLSAFNRTKLLPAVGIMSVLAHVVDELDGEPFGAVHGQLFGVIAQACSSDYAPLALRGLRMWANAAFVALCSRWPDAALAKLLPAVWRSSRGHVDGVVAAQLLAAMDVLAGLEPSEAHAARVAALFPGDKGAAQLADDDATAEQQRHRLQLVATKHADDEAAVAAAKRQRAADPALRLAVVRAASKRLHFVFGKVLGFGAYATVRYAKTIETDVPQGLWLECAVKLIDKKTVALQDCASEVARELRCQQALSARLGGGLEGGIVPLWHTFEDGSYYCMVSPFCRRGDVFDAALGSRDGSSCFATHPAWITFVILRVGTILAAIHAAGYYYGDLKPENVLIFERDRDEGGGLGVALTDFGASMEASELNVATRFGGTLDYLAPELLQRIATGDAETTSASASSTEAWAFGVFAAYLLSGQLPFGRQESVAAQIECIDGTLRAPQPLPAASLWPDVSALLRTAPGDRMSIDAALRSPFFDAVRHATDMPPMPPRLRASAGASTTNAGRRESMLWKQVRIAQCLHRSGGGGGGSAASSLAAVVNLQEAPVGTKLVALQPRTQPGSRARQARAPAGVPG
jgi:serine/threonine protein kinase